MTLAVLAWAGHTTGGPNSSHYLETHPDNTGESTTASSAVFYHYCALTPGKSNNWTVVTDVLHVESGTLITGGSLPTFSTLLVGTYVITGTIEGAPSPQRLVLEVLGPGTAANTKHIRWRSELDPDFVPPDVPEFAIGFQRWRWGEPQGEFSYTDFGYYDRLDHNPVLGPEYGTLGRANVGAVPDGFPTGQVLLVATFVPSDGGPVQAIVQAKISYDNDINFGSFVPFASTGLDIKSGVYTAYAVVNGRQSSNRVYFASYSDEDGGGGYGTVAWYADAPGAGGSEWFWTSFVMTQEVESA